jgi:hypothetical protein
LEWAGGGHDGNEVFIDGKQCQHLIAGWYYCVAAPKVTATAAGSTAVPTETCNSAAPKPTMPVEVKCGCKQWHEIVYSEVWD